MEIYKTLCDQIHLKRRHIHRRTKGTFRPWCRPDRGPVKTVYHPYDSSLTTTLFSYTIRVERKMTL